MDFKDQQEREEYQIIFENATEGIFQSSIEGRFLKVNPAMARIFGYDSPEDMIKSVSDISKHIYVDQATRGKFVEEVISRGYVEGFEARNFRKDGSIIWTRTNARIVRDKKGNPLYFEGFLTDITLRIEAEIALKESEEKYRALLERLPGAVFLESPNNSQKLYYVNPKIEDILGYSQEEYVNEISWSDILHPEDGERVLAESKRTDETGDVFLQEYRIRKKTGEYIWIREETSLVKDEHGKPLFWQGFFLDISEQKQAEYAILQSEEQFKRIFQVNPIASLIATLEQGVFIAANDAYWKLSGYAPGEIIGRTSIELGFITKEKRQGLVSKLRNERTIRNVNGNFITKDGEIRHTLEFYELLSFDNQECILAMFHDMTEQVKAQRELKDNEEKYRQLFESESDAILLIENETGNILEANVATALLYGYSKEELLKKKNTDLSVEVEETRNVTINTPADKEQVISIPLRFHQKKDGTRFPVEITGRFFKWHGRSVHIAAIRDITERKKAEEELRSIAEFRKATIERVAEGLCVCHSIPDFPYVQFTVWNDRMTEITGYDIDTINQKGWYQSIYPDPDVQQAAMERMNRMRTGNDLVAEEWEIVSASGKKIILEISTKLLTTEDGESHVLALMQDVTEKRHSEKALQRQLMELSILHNVAVAASTSKSENELIQRVTETIGNSLYPDNCGIELLSRSGDILVPHSSYRCSSSDKPRLGMPISKGITGKVASTGVSIRLGDVRQDPDYIEESAGIQSELCVPIQIQERIIGVINVESRNMDAFSEVDERLLNTIAGTLATAIEQLRLFETSQRQLKELTILNKVSLASTTATSVDDLIEKVTQIISESLYPDNSGVLLLNEAGTALIPHPSYRGMTKDNFPAEVALEQGISGQVAATGVSLRIANVRNHKKYIEVTSQVRSELCVPITHGERIFGVVNAESRKINAFTEDDEQLLVTIASTLATAIEKLNLLGAEKKRRQEVETLLDATTTLTTSLNLDTLMDTVLETLSKIVPYDSASVAMERDGRLIIVAGRGFPSQYNVIGRKLEYSGRWYSLMATHTPLILPDVQLDPTFEPWEGSEYIRGWMGVPLVIHGKLKGFINLDSCKTNAFTDHDAILAQTFANSAAVAIENARLFEIEQHNRQKAEALREATVALTTSIELESLYKTILESLAKLLPFDSASIEILDEEEWEIVAGQGLKQNQSCIGKRYPYDPSKWGEIEVLRDPIIIPDVQVDDRFLKFEGTEYIHSWMGVPMVAQNKLVGFLNLDSSTIGFFNQDQGALAQTFGNQAAIVIENARLFTREQSQRELNAALLDLMRVAASSLTLEDVLQTILERTSELVSFSSGTIQLLEGNILKVAAAIGLAKETMPVGRLLPLDKFLINKKTITKKSPVYLSNTLESEDFVKLDQSQLVRSYLSVPLIYKEKTIGLITLGSEKIENFSKQDIELSIAIAKHASIAIENARLFEAEQRRHRESETLRQAVVTISTSLELEKVLETILIVMKPVLPYDSASIMLLEENSLRLTAANGLSSLEEILGHNFPADNELFKVVQKTEKPLILKNAQQDKRFKKWGNTNYVRGWMGVPLIVRNVVIGYLTFDSREEDIYNESLASLAQTFANQAAFAIQNARQFEAEQRHFQEAETLRQAAEAITSSLDIQQVLDSTLNNLNRVVPFDSAAVLLIENDYVRITASRGLPENINVTGKTFPTSNSLLQEIWQSGQPIILKDAQNDPRYERWVVNRTRGWMGIPLIARGNTIGYITIDSLKVDAYNQHEATLAMTFAHQAAVAIENARLYERGEQQIRQLTVLRDIDSAISSSFDLRITLNLLIEYAARELSADAVTILLYNPDLKSLYLYTSIGFNTKQSNTASHIRIGQGLAGRVVLQRKLIQIENLFEATEFSPAPYTMGENFRGYYGIPLISKGQIKGVMEIFYRKESTPDPEWFNFLHTLAGQAAIAIDNVQMFRNLQRSNQELILAYDTTLAGWGRALELRDKETQGHTDRVVELTLELARRMGITGERLTHVMRGTLLHDIGKMGIPDSILHKPGPLTEAEWVVMRQHPQYAFDLMHPIPYLRQALDIPYAHHERWDGSGYPRGLKGEEIPLAARIFAVIDIWDALLYDRVYRAAWPEDRVIEYLKNTAGIELDPVIVEKFLQIIEENRSKNQAE